MITWIAEGFQGITWLLLFFWLYAVLALNLYRGWLSGKLTWKMPAFWLTVPLLIGFVILDWVMNRTLFSLLCWQWPLDAKELVTARCTRYRNEGSTKWQRFVANTTCGMLNVFNFDNTNHC